MIFRWFKTRRELASIAATLQAENDQLKAEVKRLQKTLRNIASRAIRGAEDRKPLESHWQEFDEVGE